MGAVPHWHINASGDATCDTEESGSTVPLGIIVGLISSIGINMGQNIQALGQKTEAQRAKPCTSKVWITGLTIFVVGSIGNMVAMAFASASILVPLESSQFVTNVLFSKFYLKKFITPRQYTGTALAVLGTVFTCIFGPNDDRCFTMSQLKGFYDNPVRAIAGTAASGRASTRRPARARAPSHDFSRPPSSPRRCGSSIVCSPLPPLRSAGCTTSASARRKSSSRRTPP